ncbi:bifunctional diaminohydroxyphosphoribosylaminopyrimidine deaminase/5-amino-6-(5-phosphoribosylamino)uracil reductase RibD [Nitrincola sp. MINF-07-Sa-05]|uniref:bifunctional diaminohydroxyphosphoribosylaminopyrimidine deaminase/5-amino-6-(5-phosphoribosylamino)uracil reductase RibD n=1 Tax=Nitrincola salilacus TaxID=3400273 RepID=UPI0039183E0D
MARAIALAWQGLYSTDPNPRVGCVLVRDGQIVGEGYHQRAGEPHAEVLALRDAADQASDATAYVTLEPCSHFGRTPPCADALIKAGVKRVVAAMVDPNPDVAGNGLARLQAAGIEVACGLLEAQARELNPGFIKRMETGLPFVRVKLAMSLDGRTAMQSGESQWITGPAARNDVQALRARSSAILTGIDSVLLDDPAMTVRRAELFADGNIRQPLRVVLDSRLRLPSQARILSEPGPVLLATLSEDDALRKALEESGADIWQLPAADNGGIDLPALLRRLVAERNCNEILVECGATLAGAFVEAGLVDELVVYMAPTLLGSDARPLLMMPLSRMSQQLRLELIDMKVLEQDLRLTYRLADKG